MVEISVIMSTYKESEFLLRKAIESILNQSFTNFEFIIVLDYPKNQEHITIINEYCKIDKRIKFIINEKNLGLTSSLNKALKLASGKYIARMDADDISLPNRFSKQLAYIKQYKYDLIGGVTRIIDENEETIYAIRKIPTDFSKIKKVIKYNQCIAHPTWFGKKEMFDFLEGYRQMPLCEDYDFTLRAILKGYKISNLNEEVLKYRMTKQSISRNNLLEQFLYASYIREKYSQGQIGDIEEATAYVQKHFSRKHAHKYLQANQYFNDMLQNLEKHQWLLFVKNGVKLIFASKQYLKKIYCFIMVSLNN